MAEENPKIDPAQPPQPSKLNLRIGKKDGMVFVQFDRSINFMSLHPLEALTIANHLIAQAIIIVQEPPRIIRPI